jgi:hypothetical protein
VNIKKIIISFLLLLTYSLGFAHNFIPHQHNSETETHSHAHDDKHEHHHHNKTTKLELDHEHISHGNHFDEGLYDLLVCFLHDTDFHTDDCNNHYFIPTKTNNTASDRSLQLFAIVNTLFATTFESEESPSIDFIELDATSKYRSPSIENSPLRGPPVLS